MQERFLKLLLVGGGGLLLSPLAAFGAWSLFGSLLGSLAIVFYTAVWFFALGHFVSRDHALPVALTWEENERRKSTRRIAREA